MGGEEGGSGGATLEGSDVLFTGREFFVGISSHTNHRGAEVLADTFRDFAVSTVPVCGGTRLKNVCSMGGPDTIVISNSEGAKKTLRMMEQLTDHHYEVLTVPEDAAANCVYIRGPSKIDFLLHRPTEECPDSAPAFQKLTDYTLLPTACSEASKLRGALLLLSTHQPQATALETPPPRPQHTPFSDQPIGRAHSPPTQPKCQSGSTQSAL
ncbi:hypothetical protein AAFF_G00362950 [Aldrovandia affinis]|uniref:Dimethylargininase n=1 Tax=Aldrovandia affinis TaxID=143900 RepID=A0AAD7R5H2_9TELE|nr:hypothetical protein AAFF_G00362950 [Aldrovandia affinis]